MAARSRRRREQGRAIEARVAAERLALMDELEATIARLREERDYWRRAYSTLWREVRGGTRVCVPPEPMLATAAAG